MAGRCGRQKRWAALLAAGEEMQSPEGAIVAAEEWLRIRRRDGRTVALKANEAQRCFERTRGRQNIVLKARQMGITTWVAGQFFLRTITRPGTLTVLVAHTREAGEASLAAVERMWLHLPRDLREGELRRNRANAGGMTFGEIGSDFRVASAADANAGRGLSIQNLHCSEVSRWPGDAAATLAGLRAALAPNGEMVLESTPNGAYGAFYEEWLRSEGAGVRAEGLERASRGGVLAGPKCGDLSTTAAKSAASGRDDKIYSCAQDDDKIHGAPGGDDKMCVAPGRGDEVYSCERLDPEGAGSARRGAGRSGGNGVRRSGEQDAGMVRHFFPWWMEPAYVGRALRLSELSDDERELMQRVGLRPRQMGFRRELERTYGVLRRQEFAEDAETCFRATGACCFDVEAIEKRLAELGSAACRTRRNGALEVYLPAVSGRRYCVAVDTAGGGEDGDFAAAQIVELGSGLQCAELQERLRPAELARVVAEIAREYGEAVVAVERNNHGAAVLAYLETNERYRRLYVAEDRQAGWLTTSASKAEMVTRMERLLRTEPGLFRSRRLLAECRSFVSGERGSMAAARGSHDDLLMAMCVAQAVRCAQAGGGGASGGKL